MVHNHVVICYGQTDLVLVFLGAPVSVLSFPSVDGPIQLKNTDKMFAKIELAEFTKLQGTVPYTPNFLLDC